MALPFNTNATAFTAHPPNCLLLSVVAPDWLDRFPAESTKQDLFYRWFNESPAPALLRCLSWHLSSIEPLPGHHNQHRSSLVLPISANIAADMLGQRFNNFTSPILEILEEGIQNQATAEELAGLLAAVPDRMVLLPQSSCPTLQADVFIHFLVVNLVNCVEKDRKYTLIAAEVLSRAVQRGHTQHVAATVAGLVIMDYSSNRSDGGGSDEIKKGEVIASIVAEFPASSALEKLVEAILRVLPLQYQRVALSSNVKLEGEGEGDGDGATQQHENAVMVLKSLKTLLPLQLWQHHSDIRYLFQDKLVTQKVLPTSSLDLLLAYLNCISNSSSTSITDSNGDGNNDESGDNNTTADVLAAATWRVACQWGEKSSIQRLSTPQQAYMTFIITQSLHLLGKSRFEGYPGLLPALLRGISARLGSPREPIRRQAMRVGKIMSQILDSNAPPLFGDEETDVMVEEQWEVDAGVTKVEKFVEKKEKKEISRHDAKRNKKKATEKNTASKPSNFETNNADEDYPMTETDSDDDTSDSSSDDSAASTDSEFEKYDLEESDDDDDVAKTNLQLRDIISLIQKSDSDWKGHLRALRSAETLIRAAPDELAHYAVPLARVLLLATAPAWADEELPRGKDPIEDQRFRSLVALTAAVPEEAGLSLAAEVYSPSLDVQQRSRALAVMAAAAQELSSPGSILKTLEESGVDNMNNRELSKSTQRYLQGEKVPGKAGRVVRASERSLAAVSNTELQQQGQSKKINSLKANRFPPIALKWAAALLKECDVRRHGVDLFGRDHFVLGRLLATLGTFLEASQQSLEAAPLAAAVIELIKGQNVHDNEEPYVRRAALMAASHACMAVPPGVIATALLPSTLGSSVSSTAAARSSSTALVERLEWLRGWAEETAENDPDNSCRMMGAACRGLQGALSAEAMASLAASVSDQQSLTSGTGNVILPSFSGGMGAMPSVNVSIPRVESLNLR
jgi:Telomere length regulation protein